jgi:hypothetical protein
LIKGVVGKINKKPYEGKTLTSFALKGQDGWYSLGERAPTFQEGDSIQFSSITKGRYQYAQDIQPWVDGGATSSPGVAEVANASRQAPAGGFRKSFGAARGGAQEKDKYWADKETRDIERERYQREVTQPRIEIQAARNAAIAAATVMWEKEIVKIPTKQADKYDAFLALVETLTDDFITKTASRLEGESERNGDDTGVAIAPADIDQIGDKGWDE